MSRSRLRRLFRVSLRTLLLVATLLCVLLGMKVMQVKRQREVVAWVQESRGTAWYRLYKYPHESVPAALESPSLKVRVAPIYEQHR